MKLIYIDNVDLDTIPLVIIDSLLRKSFGYEKRPCYYVSIVGSTTKKELIATDEDFFCELGELIEVTREIDAYCNHPCESYVPAL